MFYLYSLYLFRFCSGLPIAQVCSINYALVFRSVKILKNCLFRSVFSIYIYKNIIFNVLLLFKLFLLVIKLHESSQLISQFLSDMLGNWGKAYIWGLLALPFKKISIPTFQYFFSFFQLICKNLKSNHHLVFVALVPELEILQFWYINYLF